MLLQLVQLSLATYLGRFAANDVTGGLVQRLGRSLLTPCSTSQGPDSTIPVDP